MNIHIRLPATIRLSVLKVLIGLSLIGNTQAADLEFNTDILDVNDKANIDLSQFSRPGYLMPGEYSFTVYANKQTLPEQTVFFYADPANPKNSLACLSPALVNQLGLKKAQLSSLNWWHQDQCLVLESLPGTDVKADMAESAVYINIPQAYLEYSAENWDPPSRWEEGIPGVLLDYNMNAQVSQQKRNGSGSSYTAGGNGVAGANLSAWRLRGDWQMRQDKRSGAAATNEFNWSRFYAYRAIKSLNSKLTVGEDFLASDIFDSFRFTGMSLVSDTNMLPPNLRGYAPEVTGVARSNATVIISQQGRVIYQTQVAAGPFRIQDLSDSLAGELDVQVKEQDGSTQSFTVSTASIPYLTRPGMVRYKLATGRPSDWRHHVNGDMFASGEFSWGVSNGWSLYGGGTAEQNYLATALGVGRDLLMFGAMSFDVTHSVAHLPDVAGVNESGKSYSGNSYRLSYSKRFDTYNSQISFAGYRFSQEGFMSMSEYLDARTTGIRQSNSKEMYTLSYNQQFTDLGLSAYVNYYHQTYWNQPDNDRYSLSLARNFDVGRVRNVSVNLTAYRNRFSGSNDDGMYVSLSLPWGNTGSLRASGDWDKSGNSQRVSYYDRIDERSNYQVSSGWGRSGGLVSGFYSRQGDLAQVNANATYQQDRYTSAGFSMQGGMTATGQGAAIHRGNQMGGTRIFVDTDGVADIPLRGNGAIVRTNSRGQAVLTDTNSYYRSMVSVDLNALPDNAEVAQSVKQGTLTEGAIGYRAFDVVAGSKAMANIRLADNSYPPFGATVFNQRKQQVGIVNDSGNAYLSGLNPGEKLLVNWDSKTQCEVILPASLSGQQDLMANLLLPCK
ncbi:PapC/FimD family outer membrane usher protein [Serratia fonticola]|uniref:outer membrane usher protein n=1 Tax=Serratia fonticola TaxID=47917 RepID=UPI000BFE631C|nr:outer membrane usher protein [Serratia fonticola]ATM75321.1 PapC/FimD family outer membrane usher protein [Serratia fonticola]